ncbi:MAG: hypothetical protein H0U86_10340 [Chloroflexi bacterium]|nr:hypothetical protein [Chloroflexota bacterium]
MPPTPAAEPFEPSQVSRSLLEYVTLPFCRDCSHFEALLGKLRHEFPSLEARAVPADSPRGRQLSLEQGIMRFPVIVLGGAVIAIETIPEDDLRRHLERALAT